MWTLPEVERPVISGQASASASFLSLDVQRCLVSPAVSDTCRRASGIGSGVLLSLNRTQPFGEVVEPLALRHHRGEFTDNLVIERYRSFGIESPQVMLAALWCGPGNHFNTLKDGDWPGDDGNWSKWEYFIKQVALTAPQEVVFDIWNEPDGQYFWNRSREQYFASWHVAVRVLRQWRPGAHIVGPSISTFNLGFVHDLLLQARDQNTVPDIVSWHWYSFSGREIPFHVAQVRSLILDLGLQASVRGISINEIVPAEFNFNPAVHVAYFANLERAAVDSAMHACWPEPTEGQQCSMNIGDNCGEWSKLPSPEGVHGRSTLDGLLTCDGLQLPRGVWWAYKAYGRLEGVLLECNATTEIDAVVAIADNSTLLTMLISRLAGNHSGVRLHIKNLPRELVSAGNMMQIGFATISNTGTLPLRRPQIGRSSAPSDHYTLELAFDIVVDDALFVVLGHSAHEFITSFSSPPQFATGHSVMV